MTYSKDDNFKIIRQIISIEGTYAVVVVGANSISKTSHPCLIDPQIMERGVRENTSETLVLEDICLEIIKEPRTAQV
jgi:hypothetical protein